jgi:hypothetical protein
MPRILLAIVAGFGFGVPWLFYLTLGGVGGTPGVDSQRLLDRLVFPEVLSAAVENALSFGLPFLIVLAAASFGGEFAWGTVRLMLARGEGRTQYVLSKLAAVAQWWLLAVATGTLTALVAGTTIAAVDGAAGPGSVGIGEWAGFGGRLVVAWLASCVYAALAALFAVRFRSTAFGLGLGLMAWFGEGIVAGAAGALDSPAVDLVVRAGIAYNLRSVLGTLDGRENPLPLAVAVLLFYGGGAILGAIRHLRRHDVVVAGIG